MSEKITANNEILKPENSAVNDGSGTEGAAVFSVIDDVAAMIVDHMVRNRPIPVSKLLSDPNAVTDYVDQLVDGIFNPKS